MRRYHHIGIPTSQSRPEERQIGDLDIFVVGHENSEYGVEWMRFGAKALVPDLVRQVAHVAFEVNDLASELDASALPARDASAELGHTIEARWEAISV